MVNRQQEPVEEREGRSKMPQPYKGPRIGVSGRVPVAVKHLLDQRRAELGLTESQLIADVLSLYVGRPDLVRELRQEVLPLTA